MNSPQAPSHDNNNRNARLKLLLVIFLFLGPLLAAFLWYYGFGANLAPAGQSNHSPLISPPVPLQLFENPTYDGELVDNNFLKKKWTIVHIIGESCNEFCKKSLYNTRQSRLALGKGTHRVQRMIILSGAELAHEVAVNHTDATVASDNDTGIEVQLKVIMELHPVGEYDALLVDPLGNVMMSVPLEQDPRLLVKDLKKLLKLSRIG